MTDSETLWLVRRAAASHININGWREGDTPLADALESLASRVRAGERLPEGVATLLSLVVDGVPFDDKTARALTRLQNRFSRVARTTQVVAFVVAYHQSGEPLTCDGAFASAGEAVKLTAEAVRKIWSGGRGKEVRKLFAKYRVLRKVGNYFR